jgi:hypothetical protein
MLVNMLVFGIHQAGLFTWGIESDPVVVFNIDQRGEGDMFVLSSFSRFMATSFSQTNKVLMKEYENGVKQCNEHTIELMNIVPMIFHLIILVI